MMNSPMRPNWKTATAHLLCVLMAFEGAPLEAASRKIEARRLVVEQVQREAKKEAVREQRLAEAIERASLPQGIPSRAALDGPETVSSEGQEWDVIAPPSVDVPAEPVQQAVTPRELPQAVLMAAQLPPGVSNLPPSPPRRETRTLQNRPAPTIGALKAAGDGVPLLTGKNLVSLPADPIDPTPAAVFGTAAGTVRAAWTYDACDPGDPWKLYDPNDAAASDLVEVTAAQGLWVDSTAPSSLAAPGDPPARVEIDLCPGWNLVGYPSRVPRHPRSALQSIEGKYARVYANELADVDDPWEVFDPAVPEWGNDLVAMQTGRGYWILATEAVTLTIVNEGDAPVAEIAVPQDLSEVTAPTEVIGTATSELLREWRLEVRRAGTDAWQEIAKGGAPVENAALGTFDPTLLENDLYELRLQVEDVAGAITEQSASVVVEGQMKIGHFTLSFVDLAIPLSGLDLEIVRTYDSRQRLVQGDFGQGWRLDIRQGSYRNNRTPGEGWRLEPSPPPFVFPCSVTNETQSHLTTVRLSDREVYRFRLRLADLRPTTAGCYARAEFAYVDGPLPNTKLEILGSDEVFYSAGSDRVIGLDSLEVFEPEKVRLVLRDGRQVDLDLQDGVEKLEDANGNALEITLDGITHSSGVGIQFERDSEGRIERIVDLLGRPMEYRYDAVGDLILYQDRAEQTTRFTYRDHRLEDIVDARGIQPLRNEYDADGRLVRHIDAFGKVIAYDHRIDERTEIVTDRLGHSSILKYDDRGNVVEETNPLGHTTTRAYDERENLLSETNPLGDTTQYEYAPGSSDPTKIVDPLGNETKLTYDPAGRLLTLGPDPISWTPDKARYCAGRYPWPEGNDASSPTSTRPKLCAWSGMAACHFRRSLAIST